MKKKLCPKCKIEKPLYMFGMRKNKFYCKNGETRVYYYYQSWCKACRNLDTQTSPNHLPKFDTLPEYYGEE